MAITVFLLKFQKPMYWFMRPFVPLSSILVAFSQEISLFNLSFFVKKGKKNLVKLWVCIGGYLDLVRFTLYRNDSRDNSLHISPPPTAALPPTFSQCKLLLSLFIWELGVCQNIVFTNSKLWQHVSLFFALWVKGSVTIKIQQNK